jgi:hypothetical protein
MNADSMDRPGDRTIIHRSSPGPLIDLRKTTLSDDEAEAVSTGQVAAGVASALGSGRLATYSDAPPGPLSPD